MSDAALENLAVHQLCAFAAVSYTHLIVNPLIALVCVVVHKDHVHNHLIFNAVDFVNYHAYKSYKRIYYDMRDVYKRQVFKGSVGHQEFAAWVEELGL